jgi:hypothetical protein
MSLRLLDDDYNCLPIGLLFSIDYPYRYIGDFKRGQCTYCGRHA